MHPLLLLVTAAVALCVLTLLFFRRRKHAPRRSPSDAPAPTTSAHAVSAAPVTPPLDAGLLPEAEALVRRVVREEISAALKRQKISGKIAVTADEAVEMLGIPRAHFRVVVDAGYISPVYVGRRMLFPVKELDAYFRSLGR